MAQFCTLCMHSQSRIRLVLFHVFNGQLVSLATRAEMERSSYPEAALTGVAVGMQAMVCEPKEEKYAAMNLLPVATVDAKSYEQPVDILALQKKSLAVLAAGGRAGVMLEGKVRHRLA